MNIGNGRKKGKGQQPCEGKRGNVARLLRRSRINGNHKVYRSQRSVGVSDQESLIMYFGSFQPLSSLSKLFLLTANFFSSRLILVVIHYLAFEAGGGRRYIMLYLLQSYRPGTQFSKGVFQSDNQYVQQNKHRLLFIVV